MYAPRCDSAAFFVEGLRCESTCPFPRLGKLRLDDLGVENQQMFAGYLAERVSRKTVLNVVGTLSSMMNTAKNWGYICDGVNI